MWMTGLRVARWCFGFLYLYNYNVKMYQPAALFKWKKHHKIDAFATNSLHNNTLNREHNGHEENFQRFKAKQFSFLE